MSALRFASPEGVRLVDLGPSRHVPLPGVRGHAIQAQSGDSDHQTRDWAALKRAQRDKMRAER